MTIIGKLTPVTHKDSNSWGSEDWASRMEVENDNGRNEQRSPSTPRASGYVHGVRPDSLLAKASCVAASIQVSHNIAC